MMTKVELYQSKMIILDEALDKIKSHDTIAAGHYGNAPGISPQGPYHCRSGRGCDHLDQQPL